MFKGVKTMTISLKDIIKDMNENLEILSLEEIFEDGGLSYQWLSWYESGVISLPNSVFLKILLRVSMR